jgi:hypothetical protein
MSISCRPIDHRVRAQSMIRREITMHRTLWILQALLAALFLLAGGMKLVLPIEALTRQMALPGWFLRFTGTAEVLGALGLVLPGVLGVQRGLTAYAAAGLVLVMIGATAATLAAGGGLSALIPAVVGLLAAFVVYGRSRGVAQSPSAAAARAGTALRRTQPAASGLSANSARAAAAKSSPIATT